MKVSLKLALWFLCLGFAVVSCDDNNFVRDKDSSSEKNDGNSEDETADEPVMVGGAYLTCVAIEGDPDTGQVDIGCGLYLSANQQKADLGRYSAKWEIKDASGAIPMVPTQVGTAADKFHQLYKYQDTSFRGHVVNLSVTDQSGRVKPYEKSLETLDKDFSQLALSRDSLQFMGVLDTAKTKQTTTQLPSMGCLGDGSSNSGSNLQGSSNSNYTAACTQSLFEWGVFIKKMTENKGLCKDGAPNYSFIQDNFQAESFRIPHPAYGLANSSNDLNSLKFVKGRYPCIVNHQNIRPKEDGGCFIVPVVEGPNSVTYKDYFVNPVASKINAADLEKMTGQFSCR